MARALVITAEHSSNHIPTELAVHFEGWGERLVGHESYDLGAREAACDFAARTRAPLTLGEVSRLVVDLNRSLNHPRLISTALRGLGRHAKCELIGRYHAPFREKAAAQVRHGIESHRSVLHLSVHSFAETLDGKLRNTDIGLLYDPRRLAERRLATTWQRALRKALPALSIHRNAPYRGVTDGHTTALRREFPDPDYIGIELELNQRHWRDDRWRPKLIPVLLETLVKTLV